MKVNSKKGLPPNTGLILSIILTCTAVTANAQVPVHEEPMHHPVLTTKDFRILDVVTYPKDTSLLHTHGYNYCYVTLNGGAIWIQNNGEAGRQAVLKDGLIGGYYDNPKKPLIHRFANRSDSVIRLIAIENLSLSPDPSDTLYVTQRNEEILLDNNSFRIIKISLLPKSHQDMGYKKGGILINLEKKPIEVSSGKKSLVIPDWTWYKPKRKLRLFNPMTTSATAILVQVK